MKSLIEEASSISKAIEKGWANAGKPKEFSIKVYEEPEKNFIGMTTKPAKIGIFFTEPQKQEKARPKQSENRPVRSHQDKAKPKESRPLEKKETSPAREITEPREFKEDLGPIWSDEMVVSIKSWVSDILHLLDRGAVPFTITPKHFHLRIEFSGSILDNKDKQKHLFALLSGLLMTMLKKQNKRPLRGYKIVLTEI